jgi:hypothetical protein
MIGAREEGERLAQACTDKAARVTAFDAEGARETALRLLMLDGPTPGEALVEKLKARGYIPHDDRAMGVVFSVLARRGQIKCIGHCARSKGHGTAGGRVWQATAWRPMPGLRAADTRQEALF